jgi:hypothetical protein
MQVSDVHSQQLLDAVTGQLRSLRVCIDDAAVGDRGNDEGFSGVLPDRVQARFTFGHPCDGAALVRRVLRDPGRSDDLAVVVPQHGHVPADPWFPYTTQPCTSSTKAVISTCAKNCR